MQFLMLWMAIMEMMGCLQQRQMQLLMLTLWMAIMAMMARLNQKYSTGH
jgi:hypothetical protein